MQGAPASVVGCGACTRAAHAHAHGSRLFKKTTLYHILMQCTCSQNAAACMSHAHLWLRSCIACYLPVCVHGAPLQRFLFDIVANHRNSIDVDKVVGVAVGWLVGWAVGWLLGCRAVWIWLGWKSGW